MINSCEGHIYGTAGVDGLHQAIKIDWRQLSPGSGVS